MKKSLIAVGVIAVLGAGWIGASWYTGKVIESKIDHKLTQFSDIVNNNQNIVEVKISYTDYQRGLFSTTLHVMIEEINHDEYAYSENDKKIIAEDNITIYHGPFPWSEVKSFNLMPQLAGLTYEMTKESNEKLWEITHQKPYLTMRTAVDYGENIKVTAKTIPVTYQDDTLNEHYDVSSASFDFSTDKYFTQAELALLMDKFYVQNDHETVSLANFDLQLAPQANKSAYDLTASFDTLNIINSDRYDESNIKINKLAYQSTLDVNKELGFTYNDKLNIDNVMFNVDDIPVVLKQINVMNNNESIDNENITGVLSYTLDGTTFGKQELGSSKGKLSFENLPFTLMANHYINDNIDQTDIDHIKFNLESLSLTNDKGNMDISLLMEASGLGLSSLGDMGEENLDEAKFTANVPFDVLSYLVAQVSHSDAETVKESEVKEAQQSIMMLTMFLARSPIFNIITDDSADKKAGIYSDISYSRSNDEAYINGQEVMVEDFFDELR